MSGLLLVHNDRIGEETKISNIMSYLRPSCEQYYLVYLLCFDTI